MRFVIVDWEGASRDYFDQRQDVVEALRELESEHEGTTRELLVVTYNEDGTRLAGPERGDEVLARYSTAKTYWFPTAERAVRRSGSASAPVIRHGTLVAAGTSRAAGSA